MDILRTWTILLSLWIHKVSGQDHKDAKVVENRKHEDLHLDSHRIHVRESGLEGFAKDEYKDPRNVLKMEQFVRNKEHIKQHVHDDIDFDPDTASEEELDFHFFTIHDSDTNRALDGLELLEAIMHGLEEQFEDIQDDEDFTEEERQQEYDLMYQRAHSTVDKILRDDDIDQNGYISYEEFVRSRRAASVVREAHEDDD